MATAEVGIGLAGGARAAVSALYWSQLSRRSEFAVRTVVAGLTADERDRAAEMIRHSGIGELDDAGLLARMTDLAGAA
ncbi:MAG TPA: hypothetical protein VFG96_00035 [Jiangellaceae bacterium]|nr:hypothetical protein [Jiangellaceae bacterium]